MSAGTSLLLEVLREPARLRGLNDAQWDRLLVLARKSRQLARIGAWMEAAGSWEAAPLRARDNMQGARAYVDFYQRQIDYELELVAAAVAQTGAPILLLKGAAYTRAGLPPAPGRSLADLDILVPRDKLDAVERALLAQGWASDTEDPYDQHYYRAWMHEIPPLKHPVRGVEVDVHHNLLPLTGRYRVDAELLWAAARPLAGGGRLYVLAPADMVLHSAAHLLVSDELRGGLRDLVDIHLLCAHFAASEADFYATLAGRANELGLSRPLFYALHAARQLLHTPVPHELLKRALADRANPLTELLMTRLVRQVLAPREPGQSPPGLSQWLLYVRSHWLRMPPALLARHLLRKALRREAG